MANARTDSAALPRRLVISTYLTEERLLELGIANIDGISNMLPKADDTSRYTQEACQARLRTLQKQLCVPN